MNYSTNEAQHYHEQAEKLRRLAADSDIGDVREQLLILAEDYDQMAGVAGKARVRD